MCFHISAACTAEGKIKKTSSGSKYYLNIIVHVDMYKLDFRFLPLLSESNSYISQTYPIISYQRSSRLDMVPSPIACSLQQLSSFQLKGTSWQLIGPRVRKWLLSNQILTHTPPPRPERGSLRASHLVLPVL